MACRRNPAHVGPCKRRFPAARACDASASVQKCATVADMHAAGAAVMATTQRVRRYACMLSICRHASRHTAKGHAVCSSLTPYAQECGRLLKCGNHRCKAPCHSGKCLPCTRELHVACACGTTSYRLPCGCDFANSMCGRIACCCVLQVLATTSDKVHAPARSAPSQCTVHTADGKLAPGLPYVLNTVECHASAAMQRTSRPTGRCRHVRVR